MKRRTLLSLFVCKRAPPLERPPPVPPQKRTFTNLNLIFAKYKTAAFEVISDEDLLFKLIAIVDQPNWTIIKIFNPVHHPNAVASTQLLTNLESDNLIIEDFVLYEDYQANGLMLIDQLVSLSNRFPHRVVSGKIENVFNQRKDFTYLPTLFERGFHVELKVPGKMIMVTRLKEKEK